jgi:hypothetical protein
LVGADSAFPVFVDGEYHHTESYIMGWNPDSATILANKREVRKSSRREDILRVKHEFAHALTRGLGNENIRWQKTCKKLNIDGYLVTMSEE